ncbi:hypothetical protein [Novipirellula artificiosorum]|uniref:Uncharacterized protein n=1 Tax=Novipirellula artificiosorum TaxID=2528016 RepID=A0A5C6E3G4_9BACT|nr:hypothetical protein [Novipirellula artificiosorum]TWU41729.1 hypothetical protein Poly41_00210 [Novipirellula artificiosorum]
MAKKKASKVNAAQAIRDYDAAHPGTSPKKVAEDLKKQGIDINGQYVSTIRSNAKRNGGKTRKAGRPVKKAAGTVKRGRPPRSVKPSAAAKSTPFDALLQLQQLTAELGGYQQTREALDLLETVANK